jgi:hypothetical protein
MPSTNSTNSTNSTRSRSSHSSSAANFNETAKYLRKSQPHLRHNFEESRFRGSLVSIRDYDSKWDPVQEPIKVRLDFSDAAQDRLRADFLTSLRRSIGSSTKPRVIIVEDLCSDLAQTLNNVFGLSPEVCEDYLVNSGWNESHRYVDTESSH